MKLIRTAKLKLNLPVDQLCSTFSNYTSAYNFICSTAFPSLNSNGVSLHHLTYSQTKKLLPSQLAISARMKATETIKSLKALKKSKQAISCPKSKLCSIRLDKNSYTLWRDSKTVSILTCNGRIKLQLNIPKYFDRYLDWKNTSADLILRKNKVFLDIVFEKEVPDFIPNGKIIGVDRGIKKLAVTSNNRFFGGGPTQHISKKYQEQRSQLQSKQTRSAKRHLAFVKGKERRFRANTNHTISKQIVAKLQSGDKIVLEDLTGIRKRATKFRKAQRASVNRWNFYQLEQFLIYKAIEKGIEVVHVDARYTSQRCSKCGHIKKSNRQNQSMFRCKGCGFSHNADLNAAKNICLKFQDATGYPEPGTINYPNEPKGSMLPEVRSSKLSGL